MRSLLPIHGRNHRPGGSDPIYPEGTDAIRFNVENGPLSPSNYLHITTTDEVDFTVGYRYTVTASDRIRFFSQGSGSENSDMDLEGPDIFLRGQHSSSQYAQFTLQGSSPQSRLFVTDGSTGGDITIEANGELALVADNADVTINALGDIIMSTLPTSDPGRSGALWNSSGTIKISP